MFRKLKNLLASGSRGVGAGPAGLDGALAQADLAFVKREGQFRKSNLYATADQWSAQPE